MEIAPRISVDKKVRFGKPVISGTRIPVDLIIGKLSFTKRKVQGIFKEGDKIDENGRKSRKDEYCKYC